jgi:universal stress protein A
MCSPIFRFHVTVCRTGDDSVAGSEELDFVKVSILRRLIVYIVKLRQTADGLEDSGEDSVLFEFAKGGQMPRFNNILCPVDFDPNSLLSLQLASELAQERKATLHLVVAMPPGPEVALPFGKMEAAARTKLERLARQKVNGQIGYQVEIMMGDPSVEILQAAKRQGANLIVMATHGRKGLRHLVLGSVAEHVVRCSRSNRKCRPRNHQ